MASVESGSLPRLPRLGLGGLLLAMLLVETVQAKPVQKAREDVVAHTLAYLNIPYLWGGQHPKTGMDCSGFVQLAYGRLGLHLPRVTRDQFRATRALSPAEVRPGDFLFFTMKHPGTAKIDHIGVYMGRGYFIHASVTHGVHVDSIAKPYFLERLVGIRKYQGF